MANLIITIISIALVAAATAMGIYYGGSAYEDAIAQAAANQMISNAQQIAAAYQLYSQANGGTIYNDSGPVWNGPVSANPTDFDFLVQQQYLNSLPQAPSSIQFGDVIHRFNPYAYFCESSSYDPVNNGNDCVTADGGTLPILVEYAMSGAVTSNLKICQDIANQARGPGAPIDTTYTIDDSTSLFDCAVEHSRVAVAGGPYYVFVYRIL